MSLTVEDGTGKSDADALISTTYADTYHTDRGNSAWTGTTAAKEAAIRRASFFLSNSFRWKGYRRNGRSQALAWPRSGVDDHEGYSVPYDSLPTEILQATAEAALRELAVPGSLTPDYTPSERLESATVGPVRVSYDLSRTDAESSRPVLLIVQDLIGAFLDGAGGSRLSGEAIR